jgi:FtsP/CotA-like multicopper oxidase with cupredoxin domain
LGLLVVPFYSNLAPWAANLYVDWVAEQADIVAPKIIQANDYTIGETQVIDLINGQKILYVPVSNKPNPDVGFFPWVYTYQVLAADGEVLEQRTRTSEFLLPDEQTYIIVYTRNERAVSLRVQPSEVDSVLVPHNPDSPNFLQQPEVAQRQATLTENPNGRSYKVVVLFKNNDRLDVERMDFVYILRDRTGKIVGINSSIITGFLAGTEREAAVLDQPKPVQEPEQTPLLETIVRINYLDPEIVKLR